MYVADSSRSPANLVERHEIIDDCATRVAARRHASAVALHERRVGHVADRLTSRARGERGARREMLAYAQLVDDAAARQRCCGARVGWSSMSIAACGEHRRRKLVRRQRGRRDDIAGAYGRGAACCRLKRRRRRCGGCRRECRVLLLLLLLSGGNSRERRRAERSHAAERASRRRELRERARLRTRRAGVHQRHGGRRARRWIGVSDELQKAIAQMQLLNQLLGGRRRRRR